MRRSYAFIVILCIYFLPSASAQQPIQRCCCCPFRPTTLMTPAPTQATTGAPIRSRQPCLCPCWCRPPTAPTPPTVPSPGPPTGPPVTASQGPIIISPIVIFPPFPPFPTFPPLPSFPTFPPFPTQPPAPPTMATTMATTAAIPATVATTRPTTTSTTRTTMNTTTMTNATTTTSITMSTTTCIAVPEPCPEGWQYLGETNSCYRTYVGEDTWQNYEDYCERLQLNATLASIHSISENIFVAGISSVGNQTMRAWIGLMSEGRLGYNTWSDETPVDFTNWIAGEPDGDANVNCVQMLVMRGPNYSGWNDISCTQTQPAGVCKFVQGAPTILCGAETTPAPPPTTTTCAMATWNRTGVFNSCPDGWTYLLNNCYRPLAGSDTWARYQERCDAIGGRLATVGSIEVNNLIFQLVRDTGADEAWIGLMSTESATTFPTWTDDMRSPVNYTHWLPYRPANIWTEPTCASMWTISDSFENQTGDGFWEAMPCTGAKSGGACQLLRRDRICESDLPRVETCMFTPGPMPCRPGWTLYANAGTCYMQIRLNMANYTAFATACQNIGASLPSAHTNGQFAFLRKLVGSGETFWMGLMANGTRNDTFDRFQDGSPLNFGKWRWSRLSTNNPAEVLCVVDDVRAGDTPQEGWTNVPCSSTTAADITLCSMPAFGMWNPRDCVPIVTEE